jgi:DNA (cytosine-5)-methyltransferase 1
MGKKNTKETLADETNIIVDRVIKQGVDCVIAGFPCQEVSTAAYAHTDPAGLAGERSGLVWEAIKTYRLVGAKLLLLENVAALFVRGMGEILGNVASFGDDAEWDCISAGSVGAPHFRARAYIFIHPRGFGWRRLFPFKIQRQPEYDAWKDVRQLEDVPERCASYPSKLCRGNVRIAKRLHGIGNGNPPCVIREIMRNL